MEKLTRGASIRLHCKECSGGEKGSSRKCTSTECYLFPYRVGGLIEEDIQPHLQARANLDEKNRLMKERMKQASIERLKEEAQKAEA